MRVGTLKTVAWVMVAVGLIAALVAIRIRIRVEAKSSPVEIVVDYDEIAAQATACGTTPAKILSQFKERGATSVSILVQSVGDIARYGGAKVDPETHSISAAEADTIIDAIVRFSPELANRVKLAPSTEHAGWTTLLFPEDVDLTSLIDMPVAMPEQALWDAAEDGMGVVPRLANFTLADEPAMERILHSLKREGVITVTFTPEAVLGYRGLEEETAQAFMKLGMNVGRIEFTRQKGDRDLAIAAKTCTVSVHEITPEEMPKLDEPAAQARLRRAVRERAIRVLYVHLFYSPSKDDLDRNLGYVQRVADLVKADGYPLGQAVALGDVRIPKLLRLGIGLGIAGGAAILLAALFDLSAAALVTWIVAMAVVLGLGAMLGGIAAQVCALVSSLTFPILGAVYAVRGCAKAGAGDRPICAAVVGMLTLAVLCVMGGVLIYAVLTSRDLMLRLTLFRGIKLANLWKPIAWRTWLRDAREKSWSVFGTPVLAWHIALGLFLMAILAIMVLRGGNEGGAMTSSVEIKLRSLLDSTFFVRPRVKECIGYPMLMLALMLIARGRRDLALLPLTIGMVAAISVVNTFCHIHSPFALGLMRVLSGIIVGGLIGLVLCRVAQRGTGTGKERA